METACFSLLNRYLKVSVPIKELTKHDFEIARRIANTLTCGDRDPDTLVPQEELLALERKHFVELLGFEKTQARIEPMLNTGKRLQN